MAKGRASIWVLFSMLASCGGAEAPPAFEPTAADARQSQPRRVRPEVHIPGAGPESVRVRVQVADDDFERGRGLMFRRHLDRDAGMLFVFDEMKHATFWMENTFIPLDVLFIDDDLQIVGIVTDTVPLSEESIEVEAACRYVLEVNAGFVRTHGIEVGGQIDLIGVSLSGESP